MCSKFLDGRPAYSVTWRASLSPWPATQQVMIFDHENRWRIWIVGYRWGGDGTSAVQTRTNEITITEEDARSLFAAMSDSTMARLAAQPYYGDDRRICMDGARLELAKAEEGQKRVAAQHSCAGKTELNEIAGAFRKFALKYDPDFEGLLSALKE